MTHQIAPFGLRIPDDLKAEVKALARRDGRSMNNHIVHVLKKDVAAEKAASNPTA
ncbi:Arc family DNA-binding protein [Sphingobium sp. YR768]|uniref:Arc family DNA-binding protein n=1 Tax=Sphingobium sp. YR768 TaxID=1884365 RepID=UPI0008C089BF|nr:Arc family DNA-binding protein [Sphingobium sp. YR768]SES08699.1 Arc-like DNA binding domain-containing protein [Sphingobium sp. YR768]